MDALTVALHREHGHVVSAVSAGRERPLTHQQAIRVAFFFHSLIRRGNSFLSAPHAHHAHHHAAVSAQTHGHLVQRGGGRASGRCHVTRRRSILSDTVHSLTVGDHARRDRGATTVDGHTLLRRGRHDNSARTIVTARKSGSCAAKPAIVVAVAGCARGHVHAASVRHVTQHTHHVRPHRPHSDHAARAVMDESAPAPHHTHLVNAREGSVNTGRHLVTLTHRHATVSKQVADRAPPRHHHAALPTISRIHHSHLVARRQHAKRARHHNQRRRDKRSSEHRTARRGHQTLMSAPARGTHPTTKRHRKPLNNKQG